MFFCISLFQLSAFLNPVEEQGQQEERAGKRHS